MTDDTDDTRVNDPHHRQMMASSENEIETLEPAAVSGDAPPEEDAPEDIDHEDVAPLQVLPQARLLRTCLPR